MLKKKKIRPVLAVLAGGLLLAACGKTAGGPQVIAERTEAGQTADGALTGSEGSASHSADSVLEMTAPPARYEAKVETDKIQVVCDAKVSVPDTDFLPVYSVENQPYTEAELAACRDVLAKEIGTVWAAAPEIGEGCWESEDGLYHLDAHAGNGNSGGTIPKVWMKSNSYASISYRSSAAEAAELAGLTETELTAAVPQEEAARELLEKLTDHDMDLTVTKWWIAELKNSGEPLTGVTYRFDRSAEDVPLPDYDQALLGEGTDGPPLSYTEISYSLDGTLWEVRHIGRETISPTGSGGNFLLPFAAISEILEQYCRAYYDEEGHSVRQLADPVKIETQIPPGVEANGSAKFHIDRAALEYRYVSKAASQSAPITGTLIPVWNFYGTAQAEYSWDNGKRKETAPVYDGQEVLLVSINAEDGSVYGN